MSDEKSSNDQKAHRRFAPACFNETWELLDGLGDRPTREESDEVVLTAAASLWHWMQRDDVTKKHRSVGAWLLSRVYSVVDRRSEAIYWAQRSLKFAEEGGEQPFYVGYAYEGLARAYGPTDPERLERYLRLAHEQLGAVGDEESKRLLERDLKELEAADIDKEPDESRPGPDSQ